MSAPSTQQWFKSSYSGGAGRSVSSVRIRKMGL